MFRAHLTWRQSGLIGLTVAIGTVTVTYPGGWGRLASDVRDYNRHERELSEHNRVEKELNAAVAVTSWRQEVQTARLTLLVAGRLTLREVATEFDELYEADSRVRKGLHLRYPTAEADEVMAVMACYRVRDQLGADERQVERLHEEFRREYGKPLPAQKNPLGGPVPNHPSSS